MNPCYIIQIKIKHQQSKTMKLNKLTTTTTTMARKHFKLTPTNQSRYVDSPVLNDTDTLEQRKFDVENFALTCTFSDIHKLISPVDCKKIEKMVKEERKNNINVFFFDEILCKFKNIELDDKNKEEEILKLAEVKDITETMDLYYKPIMMLDAENPLRTGIIDIVVNNPQIPTNQLCFMIKRFASSFNYDIIFPKIIKEMVKARQKLMTDGSLYHQQQQQKRGAKRKLEFEDDYY
jgi:hypothetical protein